MMYIMLHCIRSIIWQGIFEGPAARIQRVLEQRVWIQWLHGFFIMVEGLIGESDGDSTRISLSDCQRGSRLNETSLQNPEIESRESWNDHLLDHILPSPSNPNRVRFTGPETGFFPIPVVTRFPWKSSFLGNPILIDSTIILRSLQLYPIFRISEIEIGVFGWSNRWQT